MYITYTSSRRTAQLGSLYLGLYERFPIEKEAGTGRQVDTSHTGGTVQPRAPLVYSMEYTALAGPLVTPARERERRNLPRIITQV